MPRGRPPATLRPRLDPHDDSVGLEGTHGNVWLGVGHGVGRVFRLLGDKGKHSVEVRRDRYWMVTSARCSKRAMVEFWIVSEASFSFGM